MSLLGFRLPQLLRLRHRATLEIRPDRLVVHERTGGGRRSYEVPLADIRRVDVMPLTSSGPEATLMVVTERVLFPLDVDRPVWHQVQIRDRVRRLGLRAEWGPGHLHDAEQAVVMAHPVRRVRSEGQGPNVQHPNVQRPEANAATGAALSRASLRLDFQDGRSVDLDLGAANVQALVLALTSASASGERPVDHSGDGLGPKAAGVPRLTIPPRA